MIAIPILALVALLLLLAGVAIGRFFGFRPNLGEALVANAISTRFKRPHVLLNNVTFQADNGITQIDHIVVADTGIFVIETKHYSDWIFGGPNDSHWTQVIYKKKSRFQNPIRQNYGHVKALQSLFTLPDQAFIPVVVFAGDAEIKSNLGPTVFSLDDLVSYMSDDRPVLFDERKMAYIVEQLEKGADILIKLTDDWYPALRRLAKRALCSCMDQPYDDMKEFLLAYSAAFAQKPTGPGLSSFGSSAIEIYNFMLFYWRIIDRLKSVHHLHEVLVKVFGPYRTGDLKRTEKICQRIGLHYRKPGRPKKIETIQTPA